MELGDDRIESGSYSTLPQCNMEPPATRRLSLRLTEIRFTRKSDLFRRRIDIVRLRLSGSNK